MKYKYDLSPLEKTVYDIFLDSNTNIGYEDIINLMPSQKEWNDKSVYSALNQLKKKGLIKESGKIKVARTRAILYRATMTINEFYKAAFYEYLGKMQRLPVACILSAMVDYGKGKEWEILDEIVEWTRKRKELIHIQENSKYKI